MPSPPGAWESYRLAWIARGRERVDRARERRERARRVSERLARLLVDRYGVRRVVLFGSAVSEGFDDASDIDLAVEGLPAGTLFQAGADLEDAGEGFRVDLVPLEHAWPAVRARAHREGVVLYERSSGR